MRSNIFGIISCILIFLSPKLSLGTSCLSSKIQQKVDSLHNLGIERIIVYREYFTSSPNNTLKTGLIIYEQSQENYLIEIKTIKNKFKEIRRKISPTIIEVFIKNRSDVLDFFRREDELIDTSYVNGVPIIEKEGSSHGMNYYFKIIDADITVEKNFCCGLLPNYFFYKKSYAVWLLMSAIKLEQTEY